MEKNDNLCVAMRTDGSAYFIIKDTDGSEIAKVSVQSIFEKTAELHVEFLKDGLKAKLDGEGITNVFGIQDILEVGENIKLTERGGRIWSGAISD